jgi:dihydroorotase
LASGAAGILAENAWSPAFSPTSAEPDMNQKCDLLIKGGTVIDPAQHLHATLDIAVKDGKILDLAKDLPESRAVKVVSAKDKIVTPGFIDLQVHCFEGISDLAVNADHYCLGRGTTTIVENGAAGYLGIEGYVKYIIDPAITRIFTSLNIFPPGIIRPDAIRSLDNPNSMDSALAARAANRNKPAVVGIKAYIEKAHVGKQDLECLRRAVTAAEMARIPLVADIVDTYSPIKKILEMMRKGDIFTHVYNAYPNGVLDPNGRVLPEVLDARDRGIYFDTAQGADKFSFDVTEKCMQQNLPPDSISSDLYSGNVDTMVYDLPTTVSKFLAMGMKLDDAIERVTARPAQMFDFGVQIGTLRPGSEADIGIFELREGKFEFVGNSPTDKRTGNQMLISKAVVCRGRFFVNSVY